MNSLLKVFTGFLILSSIAACSRSSENLLTPAPYQPEGEVVEKPKDLQYFRPMVDILFVIDNSASMDDPQENLKANAYRFADALSKIAILDYHVGVITTDMSDCRTDCGILQGRPNFVEKTTPDIVQVLSDKMIVGLRGSASEMMFTPVISALSPRLGNNENKGFYRDDAFLAVIIITDAKEQSSVDPKAFYDFLVQKKGDERKVLSYGVIRKLVEESICTGQEPLDDKLENFFDMVVTGGAGQPNVLSLCDPDWGLKLAEFAKDIVKRSTGSVKLQVIPKRESIRVAYGTQEIPNHVKYGWTYRASSNTIELGPNIIWTAQPPGTTLSINYDLLGNF